MTRVDGARPRVLVVAYDFPPHGAIGTMRTLRVVRELHARGWDVTVLTSDPARFREHTPLEPALLGKVPPGVRVIRAGALRPWERLENLLKSGAQPAPRNATGAAAAPRVPRAPRTGIRARVVAAHDLLDAAVAIPDRESAWLLPALARGAWASMLRARPDVIYSSAPPWTGQLVAAGLATLLRRPWVADFRDPWSRAPWREDRKPFVLRANRLLEAQVVRRADAIIFATDGNQQEFAAHYGPSVAQKFHLVSNGCDPAEFAARGAEPEPDGPFVLLHAGSLYAGRTPLPLLKAVSACVRNGAIDPARFRLRFMGPAGVPLDWSAVCRELGLEQVVELVPRVPRERGVIAMRAASALLVLQPGTMVSVPGKLYEYLAIGRPIFAIAEGETAELVRASGIGVAVSSTDPAGIERGLLKLLEIASGPIAPPSRDLFDGTLRAAETAAVLEAFVRRGRRPRRAPEASPVGKSGLQPDTDIVQP